MTIALFRKLVHMTILLLAVACSPSANYLPPTALLSGSPIPLAIVSNDNAMLANSDDEAWFEVTEYLVDTVWAPPVHPSIGLRHDATKPTSPIMFRVARDDEQFYVRLRWADDSNNQINAFDKFADAVAVQFAMAGGDATPYTMGAPNAPVNIWYWRAGNEQAQDLVAGGFGSTTLLESVDVTVTGTYDDANNGEWVVVFSRALATTNERQARFGENDSVHITLAIWQGAEGQRDGLKRTTVGWIAVQSATLPAVAKQ